MALLEGLELGREHVVQFYDREEDLAHRVARYLGSAVEAGGVAIVVATEDHRSAFEARMADAGINVAEAWSRGALLVHDAVDAMDTLLAGADRPSPEAFDQLIGSLIRYSTRRGGPVRVYGEIVALMVDAGYVPAALELEEMWNGLQREHAFSLFCAYPTGSVAGQGRDSLRQICHLHTGIDLTDGLEQTIPWFAAQADR